MPILVSKEEREMNDPPKKYEFTIEELKALYSLLYKEWTPYENSIAISVIKRIGMIIERHEK